MAAGAGTRGLAVARAGAIGLAQKEGGVMETTRGRVMKVPEEIGCFYCGTQEWDHEHSDGYKCCGNCCSVHGALLIEWEPGYKWAEECLRKKNAQLLELLAKVSA